MYKKVNKLKDYKYKKVNKLKDFLSINKQTKKNNKKFF